VGLQHQLGADIIMPLDVCPPFPASASELEQAVEFTSAWARKAQQEHVRLGGDQTLFAINQGGINKAAREKSLKDLLELDFQGYAIGGLSVGEGIEAMTETLAFLNPLLPESKPRYLMGVGTPLDLWAAFEHGVDMLDCAMPTRIARNGTLFTSQGRLNMKNSRYAKDTGAPDPECGCLLCQTYSRGYLRHLLLMGEITALRLCTLHNLTFMLDLCRQIQVAIDDHRFADAKQEFLKKYIKEK
jgi:queuine tRNA-ribosyltransferase